MGYSSLSSLAAGVTVNAGKKQQVYNQLSQLLVGYDITGAIRPFDKDGDLTGGEKINDAMFLSFSRLLVKDEIKKGSFSLTLGIDPDYTTPFDATTTVTDYGAAGAYKVNSPAGEYAVLYATGGLSATGYQPCGLLYYQAGIAVLSSSIFNNTARGGLIDNGSTIDWADGTNHFDHALQNRQISASADALRNRIGNLSFNNTTELNSTIYFCRANHNEFNFSSNPTYLNESRIQVKAQSSDTPVSYITTVGLYSADNVLLAVAKLSEPLRKDPTMEYTLRVRLDY